MGHRRDPPRPFRALATPNRERLRAPRHPQPRGAWSRGLGEDSTRYINPIRRAKHRFAIQSDRNGWATAKPCCRATRPRPATATPAVSFGLEGCCEIAPTTLELHDRFRDRCCTIAVMGVAPWRLPELRVCQE